MSLAPNFRSYKKSKRINTKSRRVKLMKARAQCNEVINKDKIALMM